jgi:hypothetical protein
MAGRIPHAFVDGEGVVWIYPASSKKDRENGTVKADYTITPIALIESRRA